MPVATDRIEFAPPPQPGAVRAFVLAVLAHLVLIAALTWGLRWQRESQDSAAEAELWSSIPQQAAPKEVAPPPPPPQPVVKEQPKPEPQPNRDAEIAIEREKQKKLAEEKRRHEEELAKKQEAQKLALELKHKEEAEKKRKEREQELKVAKLREENMKRMQGLAGATGSPSATGTAQRSSGPSDSWAGRIRARVKPNIVFTEDVAGNPSADVEVRLAPDGTIVGKRLVKSSGLPAWDDAVLRALDKTEVLPRDVDGRVHSPVVIGFKPKG